MGSWENSVGWDKLFLSTSGGTITGDIIFNDDVECIFGTDSVASIEYVSASDMLDIKTKTVDGSDNKLIGIDAGGGAYSSTRGAYLLLYGNEVSGHEGKLVLSAGTDLACGEIQMFTGGAQKVTIDISGNVGINTTSPASLLDVRGAIDTPGTLTLSSMNDAVIADLELGRLNFKAPQESNGGDAVAVAASIHALATDTFTNVSNKTDLIFSTAFDGTAEERMRITSAGYVGIGSTSPVSLLEARGAVLTPGTLTLSTAELDVVDGDELGRINFQAPVESSGTDAILVGAAIWGEASDTFAADNNSTDIVFGTNTSGVATERMRIDADGNVGIGTITPGSLLSLSDGTDQFEFAISTNRMDIKTTTSDGSDDQVIGLDSGAGGYSSTRGAYAIFNGNEATGTGKILLNAGNVTGGEIQMYTGAAQRLTIDLAGNVGIGTTSPSALMHAYKTSGATTVLSETKDTAESAAFVADSASSCAIALRSTSNSNGGTSFGVSTNGMNSLIGYGGDQTIMAIGTTTADDVIFGTSNLERVRIDSSGNVGIGTTGPDLRLGQKLDIATSANYGGMNLSTWGNSAGESSLLDLSKSRSDTIGTHALVSNNDDLGFIVFRGSDGDQFLPAATIRCNVNGTAADNQMPGALIFATNAGGTNETERMRITSAGGISYTPTAVQDVVAATGITAAMLARVIKIRSSTAGNEDITANPQIAAGTDGQFITFIGQDDTKTVQFDDNNGLQLAGGTSFTMGSGDTLTLIYDSGLSVWVEDRRSDN